MKSYTQTILLLFNMLVSVGILISYRETTINKDYIPHQ